MLKVSLTVAVPYNSFDDIRYTLSCVSKFVSPLVLPCPDITFVEVIAFCNSLGKELYIVPFTYVRISEFFQPPTFVDVLLNVCFDMFDLVYYLFALLNTFRHYMLLREHLFFLSYFPPIIVHLQSPFYFC